MRAFRWFFSLVLCALSLAASGAAQVAMPDPSQIHGKAIPASELGDGTVTVRVVRESIGNNIAGQDVSLTTQGRTRTVKTDEQGRAEFTNLPLGAEATAQAIVNGETLTSDPFTVPTRAGLRVILVAGMAAAAERKQAEEAAELQAPAQKGIVVLGPNTRIVGEFQDDTLNLFYILDITNNARTRVDIGGPFVFDLPSGAGGATPMQGSTPQGSIAGDRVTVTGPFAPGSTMVQIGFSLANVGSNYEFEQSFPAAIQQLNFGMQKIGSLAMTSSQFSSVGEVRADNGTPFFLANGPAVAANTPIRVSFTGIPSHSRVPRYVAFGLAGAVLLAGAWLAFARSTDGADSRQRLIGRRDSLLGELAQLEERRRLGTEGPKHTTRRNRILSELEQIYGELDQVGPPEGGHYAGRAS